MNNKPNKNTKILLLTVLLHTVTSSTIRQRILEENDVTFTCETSDNKTAFCVQAQNCDLPYHNLKRSDIAQLRCGPSNENRNRPYVCCEPSRMTSLPTSKSINRQNCGIHLISRIVGGEDSNPGEFPWLARLIRADSAGTYSFSCTGFLISTRVVLSTAHCIISSDLDTLGRLHAVNLGEYETECTFGQNDCLKYKKSVNISKVVPHPSYNGSLRNFANDIGLIILAEEVEVTSYVLPICVLEEPYESLMYVVGGWGRTEFGTSSRTKKKVSLPPFSWQQCLDKYRMLNITLTEDQICAGGVKGQDSCQGDSGGPLMIMKENGQWFAAGVVSFGVSCGKAGWPGIYVNLPSYIDWIKLEMAKARV